MKYLLSVACTLFLIVTILEAAGAQVPDSLRTIADDSSRAIAIGKLAANTAFRENDFDKAYRLLEEARQINQKLGSEFVRAKLFREEGIIEQSKENSAGAIRAYQQALELFEKLDKKEMQVDALNRLEQVYFKDKEYSTAEKYIQRAISLIQQNPDLPAYLLGDSYNALAAIKGEVGDNKQSVEYLDKARKAYEKAGEEPQVYITLLNSAISLRKLGLVDESVVRLKKAESYALRTNFTELLLHVYLNLPNTLMQMNDYPEAIRVSQKALDLMKQHPALEDYRQREEIYSILQKAYAHQNEYKKAYNYLQLASQTRDSLMGIEKKRELARLEAQYEARQSQQKIQELDLENEARQEQLMIVIGLLSALLLFTGLLAWQYRRLQRSKAKISEQSEQLKTLMKELHHRVKNNLAIVSSLLKLQSNRLVEESAARAVREGQQRVEAMSLIHQRLYQTDLLTSINMQEYILDLAENLMVAYGYALDSFDLRLTIEEKELDVDLAIPLGLILNELLTNSFKYAYENVQKPMLSISLTRNQGLTLEVKDNGPGLNEMQWKQPGGSFGKRLIRNLSEQTGGVYQIGNDNGTHFKLHIAEPTLRRVA
jgi:two-component sensor histidine kinase